MANELKHGSVGTELTQAEWEAIGTHVVANQAVGDIIYASSTSQLRRLGISGTGTHILGISGGVPAWAAPAAGNLTGGTLASAVTASSLTSLGTQAEDLDMGGFDVDNAGFVVLNAATAPASSEVYAVNDNTGDLTLNALSGKVINFAIAGTDEVSLSATQLDLNSNNVVEMGTLNTHTVQGGTDTFVMRATTDTLTNKTLNGAIVAASHIKLNDSQEIRFGTDVDSLIYHNGTDTFWNLRSAGAGDLRIHGGGDVIIGTDADPGARLQVDSTDVVAVFRDTVSGSVMDLVLEGTGSNSYSRLSFDYTGHTAGGDGNIQFEHHATAASRIMRFQIGGTGVLALEGDGEVHVHPSGTADADLEVSDGATLGNGAIHRASSGAHSQRALKSDIAYLPVSEWARAYADVKGLKHATFKYKKNQLNEQGEVIGLVDNPDAATRVGLIFEDCPVSVQGPHGTTIIDDRITNLELAMREIIRLLEAL